MMETGFVIILFIFLFSIIFFNSVIDLFYIYIYYRLGLFVFDLFTIVLIK